MKKLFFISAILFVVTLNSIYAQNDNSWESKVYNVGEFSAIRLEGGFRVFLVQGETCQVKVKSPDNDVFSNIRINNNNSELLIKINQSIFDYSRVSLYITFRDLQKLEIDGGVNLKTNGFLDLDDFYAEIEGGANIELNMKAKSIKIVGEGGFLFEIKGVTDLLDVAISGAGHVSAGEMKSKDVKFSIRGFGTGNVNVINTLDAQIQGVGMLKYKGNPKVNQYIDGLGSVKPLD